MKLQIIYVLTCVLKLTSGYGQEFKWAIGEGAIGWDYGTCITTDHLGNVYVAGNFADTVDFDPGPGIFHLIPSGTMGGSEIFIQKLDPNGNLIWAKNVGGKGSEDIWDIAVDQSGNVYLTGDFHNTADFNPDPMITYNLTASAGAQSDAFLLKLTSTGNLFWVKQFGGADSETGTSITLDASGNIYTSGIFRYTCDFDPGPATYNLSTTGSSDSYIVKLSSAGNFIWARQLEGNGNADYPQIIYTDGLYLTCSFSSNIDADPGPGVMNFTSNGSNDILISKINSSGNLVWAKQVGSVNTEYSRSIAHDVGGNIYICGDFRGTMDFDPGAGVHPLTSNGGLYDFFVLKLNSSGNFIWASVMGGSSQDYSAKMACSNDGNVVLTGYFSGEMDIDPSPDTTMLYSNGFEDVFIVKLDAVGNLIWGANVGSAYDDEGYALAVDQDNNIIATGRFQATADFDPGPGNYSLTANHWHDAFVVKLGPNYVAIPEQESNQNWFNSYPNPASTTLYLDLGSNTEASEISVYNAQGQIVLNQTCQHQQESIDVSSMPNGVYYIAIRSGEIFTTKKLVVQHE